MRTYTVHLPPEAGPDVTRAEAAEWSQLVADGFSPFAFALAPIWMLVNRLWLALITYVIGMVVLELLLQALGMPELAQVLIGVGIHLIIGFEADEIRRWTLHRNGWRMVAVVSGRDAEEGQVRFLEGWKDVAPAATVTRAPHAVPA